MRFIDMFAGIGGFRKGLEVNGHECVFSCEIDNNARLSYSALYGVDNKTPQICEDNKYIDDEVAVTEEEKHIFFHDVTKTKDILQLIAAEDYDIFCGGFPCQPFSRAGRRDGFKDKNKGNLFFSIIDIIEATKPPIVLLENVKGLLTAGEKTETFNEDGNKLIKEEDKGSTFKDILYEFHRIGYDVEWQVINSAHYIAHKRERVYIIARKRGERNFKRVFPIAYPEFPQLESLDIDEFNKNCDIAYVDFKDIVRDDKCIKRFDIGNEEMIDLDTQNPFKFSRTSPFNNWGIMINGICITAKINHSLKIPYKHQLIDVLKKSEEVDSKYILNENEEFKQREAKKPKTWKSGNKMGKMAFPDRVDKPSRTLTANASGREMMVIGYYKNDNKGIHYINEIIEENEKSMIVINEAYKRVEIKVEDVKFRKLTPLEYWKLQGFSEDNFNDAKAAGVSDSQLKKQAGNAVTVNVIKAIGERI